MKKNDIKKMIHCNSENWNKMKKKLMRNELTITNFFNKLIEKIANEDFELIERIMED